MSSWMAWTLCMITSSSSGGGGSAPAGYHTLIMYLVTVPPEVEVSPLNERVTPISTRGSFQVGQHRRGQEAPRAAAVHGEFVRRDPAQLPVAVRGADEVHQFQLQRLARRS